MDAPAPLVAVADAVCDPVRPAPFGNRAALTRAAHSPFVAPRAVGAERSPPACRVARGGTAGHRGLTRARRRRPQHVGAWKRRNRRGTGLVSIIGGGWLPCIATAGCHAPSRRLLPYTIMTAGVAEAVLPCGERAGEWAELRSQRPGGRVQGLVGAPSRPGRIFSPSSRPSAASSCTHGAQELVRSSARRQGTGRSAGSGRQLSRLVVLPRNIRPRTRLSPTCCGASHRTSELAAAREPASPNG